MVAIEFVTVVAKFGSSPNAAASSFNVSKVLGADETKFAIAVSVYAVVAIFVLLSLADWVVAVTVLPKTPVISPPVTSNPELALKLPET